MGAAVKKAMSGRGGELTPSEIGRVMHWSNQPPLPKPPGWGKPGRKVHA